jgi:hypothetical protein
MTQDNLTTGVDHRMGDSRVIDLATPIDGISKLVYVHITKNASCWAKHHFMPSDYYNYYKDGFDGNKYLALVVLRDPVERWISGIAQYLAGFTPGHKFYIDNIDWVSLMTKVVLDDHTKPQFDFIIDLPTDSMVWFKCDNNLTNNFVDFMKKYNININLLDEKDDVANIFNITKKVQAGSQTLAQQTIVDKITNKLNENPKYIDRIKYFYQYDYKLYNTVPYYVAR